MTIMLQPPPCYFGRAVLCPIYKGTFERREDALFRLHGGAPTRQHTEFLIQLVKDFRVGIDYLETRRNIDRQKVTYLGYSWGSRRQPYSTVGSGSV